jgi:hypothetical protein
MSESTGTQRLAWAVAVPLVLVAGLVVVALRAQRQLQHEPQFMVDPQRVSLVARPAWMPEPVAGALAADVSAHVAAGASLLSEKELAGLAQTVGASSGWIESVERIEPQWPAQAEIVLHLRRPVLTVGDVLVAGDGSPLGLGPVTLDPAPLACTGKLTGEDLAECAAAASTILPYRSELARQGVRLASVAPGAEDSVSFTTDGGVELAWGRSPRRSPLAYLDVPVAGRLDNLRQVLADHPGLQGVSRVQLWTDRPVVTLRDG